ncbi:putative RNA-directed DNA polymerase from transposon BS [Chionoecetes opilio]|uniref:Putative RNA-directed DNA polymerase from transposon BS n=1 Tax=Chionoecetes opilio TaxID=41210 RepID=A0A8J4Y0X8_CHIOP|nr:putative RNA-directed DNA polymerase from transposon BS [Chionoecetes opilio]
MHQSSPQQSGFTPGKSTTDRILALRVLVERRREFRQGMLAAYFDLKKAFDSVHLIFAESLEVLVMALEAMHEEAKPLGLEVSWLKTKVQVFGDLLDEAVQSVHACGEDIEILERFTYLVHKKGGKSEAKNYRPVSLLPVLSKVIETVVASKVREHLERNHMLCNRQFGFRQGRSAADLHLLLTSDLSAALDQGKATAVVALDIEGAFERVWHEALVTKLRAAGIDGALLPLLRDYLRDRHLSVTVSGRESEVQLIRAVLRFNFNGDTLAPQDEVEVPGRLKVLQPKVDLQNPHPAARQSGLREAGISEEDVVGSRR